MTGSASDISELAGMISPALDDNVLILAESLQVCDIILPQHHSQQ